MDNIKEKRYIIRIYKNKVDEMIQNKESIKILPFLQENMETIKFDNDLMVVWYLGMMTQKELKAGIKSVFEKEASLDELLNRYHQLKFYLRRIENDIMGNDDEFFTFLSERNVSEYELMGIVDSAVYDKAKVWKFFQKMH